MSVPDINLDDLIWQYTSRGDISEVINLLDNGASGKRPDSLTFLLRDHRTRPLYQEEVRLRNGFNKLLSFYSIIEIACLIEFVPNPLPEQFQNIALTHLEQEGLKNYYELYYPLLLPRLLRERLKGNYDLRTPVNTVGVSQFLQFLELSKMLEGSEQVETFLVLLDEAAGSPDSVVELMSVLANPERFKERIEHPPGEQDELDKALHGFFSFLTFCCEFEGLIQRCSKFPLLQSAIWHHQAYWFDVNRERVSDVLVSATDCLREWHNYPTAEPPALDEVALQESQQAIDEVQNSIAVLVSRTHRSPLVEGSRRKTSGSPNLELRQSRLARKRDSMPKQATIILESGCFLQLSENDRGYTEIGYFQSSENVSDIRVLADGQEMRFSSTIKLGKNALIEVRHVKRNGGVKKDAVKASDEFHGQLLHMSDLYGHSLHVNRSKFDSIIRFNSGFFVGGLVKPRSFKQSTIQPDGKYGYSGHDKEKLVKKPIAHNIQVHFQLGNGEALELVRNGELFWSSKDSGAKDRLEIEIIADNSTAEKFYLQALEGRRDSYWLPNDGDPPPVCPEPPCNP
jgi:hypothetical protein